MCVWGGGGGGRGLCPPGAKIFLLVTDNRRSRLDSPFYVITQHRKFEFGHHRQSSGADPEILKVGCTKFSGPELPWYRFDLFLNLLYLPPFGILSSILDYSLALYGDTHRMKQYLLFWFKLYFDCLNYKIISNTIFPRSACLNVIWNVLFWSKTKCLKCYTMYNTLIIIQHAGQMSKFFYRKHQMTHFLRLFMLLQYKHVLQ